MERQYPSEAAKRFDETPEPDSLEKLIEERAEKMGTTPDVLRAMLAHIEFGLRRFTKDPEHPDPEMNTPVTIEAMMIIAEAKIKSYTDPLTGLFNKRYMDEQFITLQKAASFSGKEQRRRERELTGFSIIIIDLDCLKQWNDSYGYPAGNEALRSIAQILHKNISFGDIAGRIGGDEFMLFIPNINGNAIQIAERIRVLIEGTPVPIQNIHGGVEEVKATVSVGVSPFVKVQNMNDDFDKSEMFRLANLCSKQAKNKGRNRVFYWNDKPVMYRSEDDIMDLQGKA
ncbi:MAG: GGDEF domain-containing protein [Patescibacteria group bacterium]